MNGERDSALGARRSALGHPDTALGVRRSALGARRSALGTVLALVLALSGLAWTPAATQQAAPPRRIVSLIPAVTQILFAIGAGPQVVAVSSFDTDPPEVAKLERVGALLDPDLEKILSLKPDLVAVYGSQADLRAQLARAGVPTYVYTHAGLADVTATISALGARVGHEKEAAALVAGIDADLDAIRRRAAGRARPRTLLVFAREPGSLRGIYASGGIGFLDDMLEIAGGDNVFADVRRESVQASTELILAGRPDVILEIRADRSGLGPLDQERAAWSVLPSVPAVRNGRVRFVLDPRTVVPGPHVAEGTALIQRALFDE
jgi:iron complex transport system substrate-binding protein